MGKKRCKDCGSLLPRHTTTCQLRTFRDSKPVDDFFDQLVATTPSLVSTGNEVDKDNTEDLNSAYIYRGTPPNSNTTTRLGTDRGKQHNSVESEETNTESKSSSGSQGVSKNMVCTNVSCPQRCAYVNPDHGEDYKLCCGCWQKKGPKADKDDICGLCQKRGVRH